MLEVLEMLEQDEKKLKAKRIFATISILFVTFFLPVLCIQFFFFHEGTAQAENISKVGFITSFVGEVMVEQKNNPIFSYWWLAVLIGLLACIWIFLLVLFLKERR